MNMLYDDARMSNKVAGAHHRFNGETCWILVTDHYLGMEYANNRTLKASPFKWLRYFLSQYLPDNSCKGKYVHLDQGGNLYLLFTTLTILNIPQTVPSQSYWGVKWLILSL